MPPSAGNQDGMGNLLVLLRLYRLDDRQQIGLTRRRHLIIT